MKARLPENIRIYAIGDIHGCLDLLKNLLEQITNNDLMLPAIKTKTLVFLGDYIDRGPDSKGVIDLLLNALPAGYDTVFLKGNHEIMLLDALIDTQGASFWMRNGGLETMESYGIDLPTEKIAEKIDELKHHFSRTIQPDHLDFFNNLHLKYECGDYFFAHAGVHPDRPLNRQKEHDLLWIRDLFLFSDQNFGKIVVHGHTPAKDIDRAKNRIGIDTAAVYGGKLTALMLEGTEQKFFSAKAPSKSKSTK